MRVSISPKGSLNDIFPIPPYQLDFVMPGI
jgi:hypothetical protein